MLGKTAEDVASAGKTFVALVGDNIEAASSRYRELIDLAVKSGKYEKLRIDLKSTISPVLATVKKDFGYGVKGRTADKAEAKVFNEFAKAADKLDNATIEEAYYFQKDLNNAIRRAEGSPIGVALGKLKEYVNTTHTEKAPEIAQANTLYAKAMSDAEELARLLKTETPAQVMRRAKTSDSLLWDKIVSVADETAQGRAALDNLYDTEAASYITKIVPKMGQSGFYPTMGALLGGSALISPTVGGVAAATTVPFFSPRLTGVAAIAAKMSTEAAKKAGPVMGATATKAVEKAITEDENAVTP